MPLTLKELLEQENQLKEKIYQLKVKSNEFTDIVTAGNLESSELPEHGPIKQRVEEHGQEPPKSPIIIKSPYDLAAPDFKAMVKNFNQLGEVDTPPKASIFTAATQMFSWLFYFFSTPFKRINPDEVRLAHKNNIPELSIDSVDRQRLKWTLNPTDTCEEIGVYKKTNTLIGKFGHYLLNVPRGQYAKVMIGNEARLYDEGYHVIHEANFIEPEAGQAFTISKTAPYITKGDLHVFNVPKGMLAKIRIGNEYQFLTEGRHEIREPRLSFNQETDFASSQDPYVRNGNLHYFNLRPGTMALVQSGREYKILDSGRHFIEDPNLHFSESTGIVRQTDVYQGHGNLHFLNVPRGSIALVTENNQPKILPSGRYIIDNANFEFERKNLISASTPYQRHYDLHHVMVAPGNIAIVSVDNETRVLQGRNEPYLFQSANFSIMQKDGLYTFPQASKRLEFNGLHYVLPDQGEVPYLNDGGQLVILKSEQDDFALDELKQDESNKEHRAFIISSPTARFGGFLDTRLQTLVFPSTQTENERVNKYKMDRNEAKFDKFLTADGNYVGVRFVVTYQITNPKKALATLSNQEEIVRHIERVVTADMIAAINATAMRDITSTGSDILSARTETEGSIEHAKESSWKDRVQAKLKSDLSEYGIQLNRLNIEDCEILDPALREQLQQQSKHLSSSRAEQNALQIQNQTDQLRLAQERKILQKEEENQAARTSLALTKQQGEQSVKQQAAKNAASLAEISLETARLEAEAKVQLGQKESELLQQPAYFNMKVIEAITEAISKANLLEATQSSQATVFANGGGQVQPVTQIFSQLSEAQRGLTLFTSKREQPTEGQFINQEISHQIN